jgi:hypothetical protein
MNLTHERQELAEIERHLSGDRVLVAVTDLFAEPVPARSTNWSMPRFVSRASRQPTGRGRAVLALVAVLVVVAGATCAAGAALWPPLVAATVIVVAAGFGTGFIVKTIGRDRRPTASVQEQYVQR